MYSAGDRLKKYIQTQNYIVIIGKMSVFNLLRTKPGRSISLVALTQNAIYSAVVTSRVFVTALYDSIYKLTKSQNNFNFL